jgi:protoporphyrinogen oxidase
LLQGLEDVRRIVPNVTDGATSRNLSRRETLGFLLGAPLAAACARSAPRHVPGEIVGASERVGHRLRPSSEPGGGQVPTIEQATQEERVEVAIVGAGPAGLSAAWRLERSGEGRFVLFDLELRAGGTSASGRNGVVPHPWGAHYVPRPSPDERLLCDLFEEMGLWEDRSQGVVRERYLVREPDERLFIDGQWQRGLFPGTGAARADWDELRRFEAEALRWAAFRDSRGRRAFALPMRESSDDAAVTELDRMSASDWLEQRGYRSKRLRWFLELATRDDYGLLLHQTSAWALMFYFAARRDAAGSAPFVTFSEGNGRFVDHFARIAGGRLRLGQLVTDVVLGPDEARLSVLRPATGELVRVVARHVILAVPQLVAARIVRSFRDAPPPQMGAFSYGPWLVANLHLREHPEQDFEPAWDNVLFDSPSLGYVSATHQALRDRGPAVWTYYLPLTGDDPKRERERLLALEHSAIADAVLSDLTRAHPDLPRLVERLDVCKWGHAMVRPSPGFLFGPHRRRAAEPLAGGGSARIHFAHSDLSGLALFEEAFDRGVAAADAALAALRGQDVSRAG